MAFWSGDTLAARLPSLIAGFDPERVDCAAYRLRMGREVYISPSTVDPAPNTGKRILVQGEDFSIPPGQFAFLLTEERVTVPQSAVAFISLRARTKLRGLVNVSGFHVDPGYTGRLLFGVYNAGPAEVHLARGDECFLIWYASLDSPSGTYSRTGRMFETIPSDIINPIAGQLQSLAGLSARIDKVEADHQVLRVAAGGAATLFIALLVLGITLLGRGCDPRGQVEGGLRQSSLAAAVVATTLPQVSGCVPLATMGRGLQGGNTAAPGRMPRARQTVVPSTCPWQDTGGSGSCYEEAARIR